MNNKDTLTPTLLDYLREVREAANNIDGNVYHGMANDAGYSERSPNWQYVREQVKLIIATLDKLIEKQHPHE